MNVWRRSDRRIEARIILRELPPVVNTRLSAEGQSVETARFWEYQLTQSQSRYLKACEMLARVRKLGAPGAVQVNIAEQQTNIAQGAKTVDSGRLLVDGGDRREVKEVGERRKDEG